MDENFSHEKLGRAYPFLHSLPLYKFYNKLNSNSELNDDDFCTNLGKNWENGKNSLDIVTVCKKLKRNVEKLTEYPITKSEYVGSKLVSKDVTDSSVNNQRCQYLNYWLKEQILKYGFSYDILIPLYNKWVTTLDENKFGGVVCEPDTKIDHLSYEDQMMETIYDMYEDYDNIIVQTNSKPIGNDYCMYVNKCIDIYTKWKCECSKKNATEYCDRLNKHNKRDIEKILYDLSCNGEKQSFECTSTDSEYEMTEHDSLEYSPLRVNPMTTVEMFENSPFFSKIIEKAKELELPNDKIINGGTLSVLGVLLLSFVLYKFTPFATWISPQRKREAKRVWRKIEQYGEQQSQTDTESEDDEEDEHIPYNIRYFSPKHNYVRQYEG
ncbi:PIR protein [Plasmodium ovale]|uniref:PIR protein n=1 Tax=Plasmodium ovale TaxID=36330 RepID=A0A1D3JDK6_PLAOA|nr:PIR protein [Plasmodium ovale]